MLDSRRSAAMALLRRNQSEGTSYLDLAEFVQSRGAKDHIDSDLEQLFRRVAFNVAIGNRDDHLRNHGFLLTPTGWRLAPAFDLNPNIDRADHVLNIDESDNRPSLATVIETAEWYVESKDRGRAIVREVLNETRHWRRAAQALRIARADIELTATALAESEAANLSAEPSRKWGSVTTATRHTATSIASGSGKVTVLQYHELDGRRYFDVACFVDAEHAKDVPAGESVCR